MMNMPAQTDAALQAATPVVTGPALTVLVLDDSSAQRAMVCAILRKWGHTTISTGDPAEALEHARNPEVSLILCDWMMPKMTGPEFCRKVRAEVTDSYAYILLLTSKNDGNALAEGLEAGADDFIAKPVHRPELLARMNAGARIVAMQRELRSKNALLETTLDELQGLYGAIDRDLDEARRLQMALLQDTYCDFGSAQVSLLLEASGHVGGDMVGHFTASDDMLGMFSLDVSGHGVASAMVAARVAGMLSDASPDQNIALARRRNDVMNELPPKMVAAKLNSVMLREVQTDRYFTICMGYLNLRTGRLRLVQAGHPHPILLRADGTISELGDGGMPIGLIADAEFSVVEVTLSPGDRVLLYSDGLTECPDPQDRLLDETGLIEMMTRHAPLQGEAFLAQLRADLVRFAGTDDFPDDLSALLVEFSGSPASDQVSA